jgi:DNA-binding NarL/FixJ family response regulator
MTAGDLQLTVRSSGHRAILGPMPETKPKRALICDGDELLRRTLGELVKEAGFEVVGETSNVIQALQQLERTNPTLIVLTIESLVLNPMEIIAELRQGDHPPEIIVVSPDEAARAHALAVGAFDLTAHGDARALSEAVAAVGETLATGERRTRPERRSGQERRQRQDWSKVISERRSGTSRRTRQRRDEGG